MCYTPTLPTIGTTSSLNEELMNVTYVLNRWLKQLGSYGRLDQTSVDRDFGIISKVIKRTDIRRSLKNAICKCRDYALAGVASTESLINALTHAIDVLCDELEDKTIKQIKQYYADQGMSERYRPLSRRLAREKIRKLGKEIAFTDSDTDDAKTTKLVRRIVEKRAAQTVHHNSGANERADNRFRQCVRRATSFSLYNSAFTEYDYNKRINGTHWKVVPGKFGKKLKSKQSYNTYEEAAQACRRHTLSYPDDPRPMSPYICECCGKWHIGHERIDVQDQVPEAS